MYNLYAIYNFYLDENNLIYNVSKGLKSYIYGLFPSFVKMNDNKILVIGAGNIAYRKISKIFEFTKNITVIASNIDENVYLFCQDKKILLINKEFQEKDLDGFDIVIAAIDNIPLQKDIYIICAKEKISYIIV